MVSTIWYVWLSSQYKDLLQLMIDAHYEPDEEGSTQQKLTDDQIIAHAIAFMLVGSETTSTTLTYVSYLLALNPTVQEKLQREIEDYFQDNPVSCSWNVLSVWLGLLWEVDSWHFLANLSKSGQKVLDRLASCQASSKLSQTLITEIMTEHMKTLDTRIDPNYNLRTQLIAQCPTLVGNDTLWCYSWDRVPGQGGAGGT